MNVSVSTSATPEPASERDRLGSIALDQWRGLALILVLISHGFFFTGHVNGIGRVGVNLFFFISGILVFRSLSRSRVKTDLERTKSFWWRRLRRLYPAMIAYTLAMFIVVLLLQFQSNPPAQADIKFYLQMVPWALGYVINYNGEVPPSPLGHLWSLACEMQFYLVAPVIYRLGGKTGARRLFVFGMLLVIFLGLGVAQPFIGKWRFHFEFAVWPMMFGFCCEYKRDWFLRIPKSLVTLILWFSVAICGASLVIMFFYTEMKPIVIASGALLLAPCLMAYLFGRPMPGIGGRWMKWLGERTYSIYLWQQPFTICDFLPNWWHPFGALVAVAVGGAWFRFFEWPFLTASRRTAEKHEKPASRFRWRKFFLLASVILFAGIVLGFWTARNRYENRLARQIWPALAPQISVVSTAASNFHSTILLLGDSRMAQWNLPELSGWRVVNAGAGGLTTGQILLCAPKLLDEIHPDVVVLEAGINDLKLIGLRLGAASELASLVLSNMTAIATECEKRNCKVLLLETWPAGHPGFVRQLIWNDAISVSLDQLNAQLRRLDSQEQGIHVVDLFKEAGINPEPGLYRDTLHFKPEVYQQLTPFLEKELATLNLPAR